MFIIIQYVSVIILCTDLGMWAVSKINIVRIITLLRSEVIIVTMNTLLDTTKSKCTGLLCIQFLMANSVLDC